MPSVFINCPYDKEFEPLHDAMIFVACCLGFTPCAASAGPASELRVQRIANTLLASENSLHDISRCSEQVRPPRHNMPFELGMAVTLHELGKQALLETRHFFGILSGVPEAEREHVHGSFSDLSGYDPLPHDGTPRGVAEAVYVTLGARPRASGNRFGPLHPTLRDIEAALSNDFLPLVRAARAGRQTVAFDEICTLARQVADVLRDRSDRAERTRRGGRRPEI